MITRLLYSSRPVNTANRMSLHPESIQNKSAVSTSKAPKNNVTKSDLDIGGSSRSSASSQDTDSPVYAPNGLMAFRNLLKRCSRRFCGRVLLGLWITYVIRILVKILPKALALLF